MDDVLTRSAVALSLGISPIFPVSMWLLPSGPFAGWHPARAWRIRRSACAASQQTRALNLHELHPNESPNLSRPLSLGISRISRGMAEMWLSASICRFVPR